MPQAVYLLPVRSKACPVNRNASFLKHVAHSQNCSWTASKSVPKKLGGKKSMPKKVRGEESCKVKRWRKGKMTGKFK